MASLLATSTARGDGFVYVGSLVEFHGMVVLGMDDCECVECEPLDPWAPARRVDVTLSGGVKLTHARCESFQRPVSAAAVAAA